MLSFGFLALTSPWMLTALVVLPVLWWLLKVTPPAPLLVRFPAVRLLFGLHEEEQTPAKTPLWLVILRMVLATLVILALAHPLLNPGTRLTGAGPLILVVDDGWAGGRNWQARIGAMDELLDQAERLSRPVMVLGTAPPASGKPLSASKLLRAADARTLVQAMAPKPWPVPWPKSMPSFQRGERARVSSIWPVVPCGKICMASRICPRSTSVKRCLC